MRFKIQILAFCISQLSVYCSADPVNYIEVVRRELAVDQITGLSFHPVAQKDIVLTKGPDHSVQEVTVRGDFQPTRKASLLTPEEGALAVHDAGEFSTSVRIVGPKTIFNLTAVDHLGEVKTEAITVIFRTELPPKINLAKEDSKIIETQTTDQPKPFAIYYTLGLGLTRFDFEEGSLAKENVRFSENALTVKAGANLALLDSRWDFATHAYFTALPVSSNLANTRARFLGFNARAGYRVTAPESNWKLNLMGGYFFSTMFVSVPDREKEFGYKNISGPQLYPTLSVLLKSGHELSAYAKFSPVSAKFSLLNFANHELAFGLGYSIPVADEHLVILSADFSKTHIEIPDLNGYFATSSAYTLGASYSL